MLRHRLLSELDLRLKNLKGLEDFKNGLKERFIANSSDIEDLYNDLYGHLPNSKKLFSQLLDQLFSAYSERSVELKTRDKDKLKEDYWFCSEQLTGMSLYVDRFAGKLPDVEDKLEYIEELGVNFLHLMPLFESPKDASDGGYAVSNFKKVDERFGNLKDLQHLGTQMRSKGMYLMLDIILNHTSDRHEWAQKAKAGEKKYQDFYYCYPDRSIPDLMEYHMPEVFPESAPGNFTYIHEMNQWVMSVFHSYQWDLNFKNPEVLVAMMDNIYFYANLGVDILRIDAPAFIWKEQGTSCQGLPNVHKLLQLIKLLVEVPAPGMAILGEAIVGPHQILEYFGKGRFTAHQCDFAYNATQMATQWDALATGDTRVMREAMKVVDLKPLGTSWINYSRCHDDIGLGYDDYMIANAGKDPNLHRKYLKDYYSGSFSGSPSKGALFGANPKNNDARISGSLASLCGLESALESNDEKEIHTSIDKLTLMQAQSFFSGGIPLIFYGDELGCINDYSYLEDPSKSYDNRWMHRPIIDWDQASKRSNINSIEGVVFERHQRLIRIRKENKAFADLKNTHWLTLNSPAICSFIRTSEDQSVFCFLNYSNETQQIPESVFNSLGKGPHQLKELWSNQLMEFKSPLNYFDIKPYQFYILSNKI